MHNWHNVSKLITKCSFERILNRAWFNNFLKVSLRTINTINKLTASTLFSHSSCLVFRSITILFVKFSMSLLVLNSCGVTSSKALLNHSSSASTFACPAKKDWAVNINFHYKFIVISSKNKKSLLSTSQYVFQNKTCILKISMLTKL